MAWASVSRQQDYIQDNFTAYSPVNLSNWQALREQLLLQWNSLTAKDLDSAGPDRHRLALLVERKCGVAAQMVETYLRNFEQTMPMMPMAS